MTNALIISALLHLLAFVSIVQGYGGKTGSFSIPGVMMVELLPAGGQANTVAAANQPTPFPSEPGFNPAVAPGPVPSLDNTAANGSEREPGTRVDDSDQLSGGDQPGFHSGQPGANPRNAPSTSPTPSPTGSARHPGGHEPRPAPPTPEQPNPEARCANCPPPPYPELARRRGIEGEVVLSVQVLPDGRVGDIFVLKSSGFPFLDEAALVTVKSYTFFPAVDETGPIASTQTITVPFRLTEP